MKKQILRATTMLILLATLALPSALLTVNAQSEDRIKADIPFNFMVGDKTLPAGEYTAQRVSPNFDAVMIVPKADGRDSVIRLANAVRGKATTKLEAKLVFHRYGNRYYLAQIWTGNVGRELLKSKGERAIERELAKNPSQNDLASNESEPEIVTVIASLQ